MTIIRKWHPAAEAFPLLQGEELQQFVEDIKANGLRKPIEFYDGDRWPEFKGFGIDGRNRNAACLALEIDPPLKYLTDADLGASQSLTAYIVSANVARRHLTSSQAATVGVAVKKQLEAEAKQRSLANLKRGAEVPDHQKIGGRENIENSAHSHANQTAQQAAEIVGTNRQYINDAERIEAEAPSLMGLIRDGKLTITQAKAALKRRAAYPDMFAALEEGRLGFAEFRDMCDAPKPQAPMADSGLMDGRQAPVPPELTDVFSSAPAMSELAEKLARVATLDKKLLAAPAAGHLDAKALRAHLDDAARLVREAIPYCVCPCFYAPRHLPEGPSDQCEFCHGVQFMSEGLFAQKKDRLRQIGIVGD